MLICLQIKGTKEVWESHKLWSWTWVWTLSPKNKLTNKKRIQQRMFSGVAGTQCFSVFCKNRELLQVQRKCGSLPKHCFESLSLCSHMTWSFLPFLNCSFSSENENKMSPIFKRRFWHRTSLYSVKFLHEYCYPIFWLPFTTLRHS